MINQTSPLQGCITSIVGDGTLYEVYNYEATITVASKVIKPYKLISMDIIRNYISAYADKTVIELEIPLGDYNTYILPNLDKITIKIDKKITIINKSKVSNVDSTYRTFNAFVVDPEDINLVAFNETEKNANSMNYQISKNVKFQLIDLGLLDMVKTNVGGQFNNETPGNVLKGLLTKYSKNDKLDQVNSIKGVKMVEPHNKEKRKTISIRYNAKIKEACNILQEEEGGIYYTGIGMYLQKNYWYVWPLFNSQERYSDKKTLELIILPPSDSFYYSKTYKVSGDKVTVLLTDSGKHINNSSANLLEKGDAITFTDAKALMDVFVVNKKNKVIADKGLTTVGYTTSKEVKEDKDYTITLPDSPIGTNIASATQSTMGRNGSVLVIKWMNSNPDLICPDMEVKIKYLVNNLIKELNATVMDTYTYISLNKSGINATGYSTETVLTLFINNSN